MYKCAFILISNVFLKTYIDYLVSVITFTPVPIGKVSDFSTIASIFSNMQKKKTAAEANTAPVTSNKSPVTKIYIQNENSAVENEENDIENEENAIELIDSNDSESDIEFEYPPASKRFKKSKLYFL